MKNRAFTLAEGLLALFVIGVIFALILPNLMLNKPNDSKLLFKKAYFDAERVVSDLINDENLYPEEAHVESDFSDDSEVVAAGVTYGGKTKFCELFAERLNTMESADCSNTNLETSIPSFTTTNGVGWYLPADKWEKFAETRITIDINGQKGANCIFNESDCTSPDRFSFLVKSNGKMRIDGLKEVEYLSSTNLN